MTVPSYLHPPAACPHCGRLNDRATPAQDSSAPEAGSVSVCFGCLGVSIYTEGLGLRLPTVEERAELDSPDVLAGIAAAVRAIRRRKG